MLRETSNVSQVAMHFTGNGIMSLAFPSSLLPRDKDDAPVATTASAVPQRGKTMRRRLPVTRMSQSFSAPPTKPPSAPPSSGKLA